MQKTANPKASRSIPRSDMKVFKHRPHGRMIALHYMTSFAGMLLLQKPRLRMSSSDKVRTRNYSLPMLGETNIASC